jgi:hypothetical protein
VRLRLPQIVSYVRAAVSRCCVLYSPPGRSPAAAAVERSGTLDASDAASCASERTQAARGVGRRRRIEEGASWLT